MFFKLLLTVLIVGYIYASSDPVNIDGNTITTEKKYINGSPKDGITIDTEAFWSLFVDYTFESNILTVYDSSKFYLSSTKDAIKITIESMVNDGTVAILNPNNLPWVPVTICGAQMVNSGDLFVSGAQSLHLIAEQWENTGTIALSGPLSQSMTIVTMSGSGSSQLHNSGDICLMNQYYPMDHQFYGGGCIHVIDGSLLCLPIIDPSDPLDNIIVLDGAGASLGYTPGGATYIVAGFGGGNKIELTNKNMISNSYDNQSGILTIQTAQFLDYFNIGTGYINSSFGMSGGTITYYGPVPNPTPSKCGVCPPAPIAPGIN